MPTRAITIVVETRRVPCMKNLPESNVPRRQAYASATPARATRLDAKLKRCAGFAAAKADRKPGHGPGRAAHSAVGLRDQSSGASHLTSHPCPSVAQRE